MPKPLIITLKEGVDPVYGFQRDLPQQLKETSPVEGIYVLMRKTSTYARGVHALQKACEKHASSPHPFLTLPGGGQLYRPLTFKEVIQARVTDYNTLLDEEGNERDLEDRLRFFDHWVDSCTGMAYKAGTTAFKIIPMYKELITIQKGFNEDFLPVEYDDLVGIELDSSVGKYDESLTKKEVVKHPAWLAAVEEDKVLLKEYRDIVFAQLKAIYDFDVGMGFYFADVGEEDELRALLVHNLYNYSNADGNYSLNFNGSFLLVAPVGRAAGDAQKTT